MTLALVEVVKSIRIVVQKMISKENSNDIIRPSVTAGTSY